MIPIVDLPPVVDSQLLSNIDWEFFDYSDRTTFPREKQSTEVAYLSYYYQTTCKDFNKIQFDNEISGDQLTSLTIKTEFLPDYFQNNKRALTEIYNKEFIKYNHYISGREAIVNKSFDNLSNYIAELKFESSYIELTDSNTIKFTLSFPDKKIVMISQSFASEDVKYEDEVIYSFFINRKLIASDVIPLQAFTQNFKKYLTL